MGLSTISYLRSIYPNSKIYYGVRGWTAKLYEEIKTDADGIIPLSIESISDYVKFYRILKELKIDHVHEMHLSGRTKKFFTFFKYILGFNYTFHNHHERKGEVLDQGMIKPLIQRDLDGAYTYLGKNGMVPSYLNFEPSFKNLSGAQKARVILGVVATRETKMWSLENYVALAHLIKNGFPEVEISVPLSNSAEDKRIEEKLNILDKENSLEIVRVDLSKLPNYFHQSKLYIGNDTGLKHIAIASGIKSYTLFGPEPPNEWHPYSQAKHPYFYIEGLECRTQTAHYCGLSTCESMICMSMTTPENVFEQIKKDI
ncbi:heptosyltransferase domain protein [Bacteriovorax sp. Seq25_V]|nr:heptosyltransferase domain protein [Bacteriovorax sp. Seq25_V]